MNNNLLLSVADQDLFGHYCRLEDLREGAGNRFDAAIHEQMELLKMNPFLGPTYPRLPIIRRLVVLEWDVGVFIVSKVLGTSFWQSCTCVRTRHRYAQFSSRASRSEKTEKLAISTPSSTRLDADTTGLHSNTIIAERLPQFAAMSRDQKWLVFRKLEEELAADDSTETPEGKTAIMEILEQRWQTCLDDASTATTWSKVQERMHAYRAQRRAEEA